MRRAAVVGACNELYYRKTADIHHGIGEKIKDDGSDRRVSLSRVLGCSGRYKTDKCVTRMGDRGVRKHSLYIVLNNRHHVAHSHRQCREDDDQDPDTKGETAGQSLNDSLEYSAEWDSGYSREHSTRPQTIGYALVDSPVALCAWIVEKFWAWTDHDGDPASALSRDEMLDDVSVYWFTGTATSSARLYWESFGDRHRDPIAVPSGISIFPREIYRPSRRWAERRYTDLRWYETLDRGGHFAAFEQPASFVDQVRGFFRLVR